ncbi:hypothetical protein, partial [Klebsiella pneumoniae]|uniref:hypothetical protein n=1 Tax=Klebsiella pneumoniae TaxID=573 RepID=UPI003969032E
DIHKVKVNLAEAWPFFDKILVFLSPQRRKDKRATELEDTLESLLNNDLFVRAYRLTTDTDRTSENQPAFTH